MKIYLPLKQANQIKNATKSFEIRVYSVLQICYWIRFQSSRYRDIDTDAIEIGIDINDSTKALRFRPSAIWLFLCVPFYHHHCHPSKVYDIKIGSITRLRTSACQCHILIIYVDTDHITQYAWVIRYMKTALEKRNLTRKTTARVFSRNIPRYSEIEFKTMPAMTLHIKWIWVVVRLRWLL